ncbi:ATP-grasp domain-containing protein [Paenibacillus sp. GbtcB18]|uniref:ATP-grasp domain-containing protein n=1 Tax=Paenibacillus sp. GbtcB18 TaxID=2824763 RepID=UPI001C306BD3|nr:ATP-grasp domain-containing protein [Paenibacillus sp. GbtcB18]
MKFTHPLDYYRLSGKQILWYMNIGDEQDGQASNYFPSVKDPQSEKIVVQQEHQLLFLARPQDTVFFHAMPEPAFLDYWKERNLALPTIICYDELAQVPDLARYTIIPFIVSERLLELKERHPQMDIMAPELTVCREINDKFSTRRRMERNGFNVTTGYFCSDIGSLEHAYDQLVSAGFSKCVLKVPYGSSGKGLKVIDNERNFRFLLNYIQNRQTSVDLLLEGWHPHRLSLTSQLFISEYEVHLLAVTEQIVDPNGVYKGTNFSPSLSHSESADYREEILRAGELIRQMGYRGVLGIDSIIDTNGELIPVIEINARLTQVTYILPLVIEQKKRYEFVESRVLVFNSGVDLDFEDYVNDLSDVTRDLPVHIDLYNFCKASGAFKNTYKLFVLVSAHNTEQLIQARSLLDELNTRMTTGVH